MATVPRYCWTQHCHVLDTEREKVRYSEDLVPHACVLQDSRVLYRPRKVSYPARAIDIPYLRCRIKSMDVVDYLNKFKPSFNASYKMAMYFDEQEMVVVDPVARRKYAIALLEPHWKQIRKGSYVVTDSCGEKHKRRIADWLSTREAQCKSLLPLRCKWLFPYMNPRGHCGVIVDEWLTLINKRYCIMDCAPFIEDVQESAIAVPFRYKSVSLSSVASHVIPRDMKQYENILKAVLCSDGAFFQGFRWGSEGRDGLSHAFGIVYKHPRGYFMDANAGCAICYTKTGLIDTCKRFLRQYLGRNVGSLYEMNIYNAHINIDHL